MRKKAGIAFLILGPLYALYGIADSVDEGWSFTSSIPVVLGVVWVLQGWAFLYEHRRLARAAAAEEGASEGDAE